MPNGGGFAGLCSRRVRLAVRKDKQKSKWVVTFNFHHADGRFERVRRVSPVQTKAGAQEFER